MKKENCDSTKCKFVETEGYGYCTCEGKNTEDECQQGEDNNCKWIHVDVFAYNNRGLNFYRKQGYHTRMDQMIKKVD